MSQIHVSTGAVHRRCVVALGARRAHGRRERGMMGRREGGQVQFLYAFDLDKVVPPDHLVRQIDGVRQQENGDSA
jgi:hypothetical protein